VDMHRGESQLDVMGDGVEQVRRAAADGAKHPFDLLKRPQDLVLDLQEPRRFRDRKPGR